MPDTEININQGLSTIGIEVTVGDHKMIDVQSIGDMGGAPETIDVTSFRNKRRVNIPGVQASDTWECTYLYSTHEDGDYRKLKAIEAAGKPVSVSVFIPGAGGEPDATYAAKGYVHTHVVGAGVSEGVTAQLSVNLQEDWTETYAEVEVEKSDA